MSSRKLPPAPRLALAALLASALAAGCAATFPMPMTAAALAHYDSGDALVAYLGQPDATPAVCAPEGATPHPHFNNPDTRAALIDGLKQGRIEPGLWSRCGELLLKGLDSEGVAGFLDQLLGAYDGLLRDDDLSIDAGLDERLAAMHRFYLERKPRFDAHPAKVNEVAADLRSRVDQHKLPPLGDAYARELLATLDLSRGLWQGKPVDAAELDALAGAGNELTLSRFAERLPDPAQRKEAKRRIARVHIALSPFDEVRSDAANVEEKLVQGGVNALDPAKLPLVKAWFDPAQSSRGVLVREAIWQSTATLLGSDPTRLQALSVMPALQLRGALFAQLTGVSRAVTVCGRAHELDPSPCLPVSAVGIDHPLAYLDSSDGAFHLREQTSMGTVYALASQRDFVLPVTIAGKPAASLAWSLTFQKPEDLVFAAHNAGQGGPLVHLELGWRASRFLLDGTANGAEALAVVEDKDAAGFHAGSAGARGYTGSSGWDGSTGSSGGECQDGGRGGDGGAGGDGGPGGDGGEVDVTVHCSGSDCAAAYGWAKAIAVSWGGPGGWGGAGGRGGSGGSGGMGRSPSTHTDSDGNVITDDPGCSAGSSGPSGSDGPSGSNGPSGAPGLVRIETEQAPATP